MKHRQTVTAILLLFLPSVFSFAQDTSQQSVQSAHPFVDRREALMRSLGEGIAVLYSQGSRTETGYRADANFWYLTGVDEPGAMLVLAPQQAIRQILLLPPRDLDRERYTGRRPPLSESLRRTLGFDEVLRTTALDATILRCVKHATELHLISNLAGPSAPVPPDLELYRDITARVPEVTIKNSSHLLETMRAVKSAEEVAAIERAIQVTCQGITELLAEVRPGVTEYQLDGVLENSFKQQGAQHMAFGPIVGAGEEATVLHYQTRYRTLEAGQLLLLDVGAEWDHYAADISRTIPVDGRFTPEQAVVYDLVLRAQNAAIKHIRPGVTLKEIDDIARDIICEAGYEFAHHISHLVGLDVHDQDVLDLGLVLKPGMVITVEPGVYLPDQKLGVRIEDDVLVTETGCRVLSDQIPRERKDVETWMARAKR
ncbi:MAG: aminopeptidase P family protein [Sedimentisphaerales bacterium]|nr:aminopeptidase P family protein [Sedimentisphaerales bacterium]